MRYVFYSNEAIPYCNMYTDQKVYIMKKFAGLSTRKILKKLNEKGKPCSVSAEHNLLSLTKFHHLILMYI